MTFWANETHRLGLASATIHGEVFDDVTVTAVPKTLCIKFATSQSETIKILSILP